MKKPFIHALAAAVYIVFIVLVAQTTSSFLPKDNILMPMTMLGVFVFSAAVMGFLFLSQPLQLFLEGRKQEAVVLFTKTVGIFACFVAVFAILIFFI